MEARKFAAIVLISTSNLVSAEQINFDAVLVYGGRI